MVGLMTFRFGMEAPKRRGRPGSVTRATLDPDVRGHFEALVMEASQELEDAGYRFKISGFGLEDWKFDVSYDMSAFVEQLPKLFTGVDNSTIVEVDLYTQGVERTLVFRPVGDDVEIECISRTSWKPDPAVETVPINELEKMSRNLGRDFSSALQEIESEIAQYKPFKDWILARPDT